jgi:L-alanine-DL-glutamate epimerase-like enolase superfamily enzyme
MRVQELRVEVEEREPNPHPIRDAIQELPGAGGVRVTVVTDTGVVGVGETWFGRIAGAPRTLGTLIEAELAPLVVGCRVEMVRAIHADLIRECDYHGAIGLATMGIAAVDTALWDALGKSLGVPCWQLWGGVRERIPAYAMVGWLNQEMDELRAICRRAVDQGFAGVKIKVGSPTLAEDLARLRAVRGVVGDEIRIMVDANQSLTTAEAITRGRAFQQEGVFWWEEPLPAQDLDGYATLARELDVPVATGENLFSVQAFGRFLRHDAVDIVQPDLRRAGGPTALLAIGALADAFHRPYASHGGEPAHLNVMACLPTVIYVETGLIAEGSPMRLVDGCVPVPTGPGFGWS